MSRPNFLHIPVVLAVLCLTTATIADPAPTSAAPSRYTFSWPLGGDQPQPRGGTTRGPAVTLDREPSSAWKALQEKNIDAFERDRRAILAMAGTYRTTFDFLEVVQFNTPEKPQQPYQSWGTEKIYVDIDDGKFISLVHILEMRVLQKDGSISEPFVTKHWRQDWRYEPQNIVEYQGNDRWQRRALKKETGVWSQTVYQVDESPRYASMGHWQHNAVASTWISGETWRPLPRREWTVRNDYQVLIGTNRHTITPTGWVQEENNLKGVLNGSRAIDSETPYRAREYGIARYERISGENFSEADKYFESTRQFWDQVRDAWASAFGKYSSLTLRGPVDKLGLFMPLFEQADKLTDPATQTHAENNSRVIRTALGDMGVPQ